MLGQTQFVPYPEQLQVAEAIPATSVTAAGATNGTELDISAAEGNILLILDSILATAGTNPTLTVTVEHRASASDSWGAVPADALINSDGDASAFGVVTAAANGGVQKRAVVRARCKAHIRVVATVGGTSTPSFKFAAVAVYSNKYGDQ